MKTYQIKCPNCQSNFDCEEEINKWKMELINSTNFLDKLRKLLEIKNE